MLHICDVRISLEPECEDKNNSVFESFMFCFFRFFSFNIHIIKNIKSELMSRELYVKWNISLLKYDLLEQKPGQLADTLAN
jgi:hypothetical protein